MNVDSQNNSLGINSNENLNKGESNGKNIIGVMLPDYLKENLDIVVVLSNVTSNIFRLVLIQVWGPGIYATTMLELETIFVILNSLLISALGTCLYESKLVPVPVDFKDDATVLKYGIGFTNICAKSAKGTSDLSRKDIKEGSVAMLEKIRCYKPKIAVFNGKGEHLTLPIFEKYLIILYRPF